MMRQSRFEGEAEQPPLWGWCANCGGAVHLGHGYFEHDGVPICDDCAKRYAWALFEKRSVRRVAQKDTVL